MIRIEKTLLFLALLVLLGLSWSEVHSFDIFWQLQSGKYIWQTKSFIYQDVFSLAADVPRVEHCWLHDLIFYAFYSIFGYGGISALKGLLVLATAVCLSTAARVRGSSWLAILFVIPTAVLLTRGGWLERPQLWTFLFFALFLLLLERHRVAGDRWVWLLVPLMAVWTNLHAGAVLAFPVLASYLTGEGLALLLKRSSLSAVGYRRLWWIALGLGVATLATPYGIHPLETLLAAPDLGPNSDNVAQIFNMDWRGTSFFSNPYFFYAAGFSAVFLSLGWKRFSLSDLCLIGGLVVMGLSLSRHTTFLFLAIGALVPAYVDAALRPILSRMSGKVTLALRMAGQATVVAVFIYFAMPVYATYGLFNSGLRTWHYPIEAADFVKQNRLPGNLYNTYDWGGYLMWTLYPEYRVFWDGRSDSLEMFRLGLQVMSGHPGWDRILDRFGVQTLVTKACTVDTGEHYPIIDRLRDSPVWALVFADESSMVFVRRDAMGERWIKQHELPGHRVDDTILSEATLLATVNPGRYMAHWEMARIYLARKEYRNAFEAIKRHLMFAPPGARSPAAEGYYRTLYPMFNNGR